MRTPGLNSTIRCNRCGRKIIEATPEDIHHGVTMACDRGEQICTHCQREDSPPNWWEDAYRKESAGFYSNFVINVANANNYGLREYPAYRHLREYYKVG